MSKAKKINDAIEGVRKAVKEGEWPKDTATIEEGLKLLADLAPPNACNACKSAAVFFLRRAQERVTTTGPALAVFLNKIGLIVENATLVEQVPEQTPQDALQHPPQAATAKKHVHKI